jgi:hypothetical protein
MFLPGQLKQIHERCFYAIGGGGTTLTTAVIVPFTIPRDACFVSMFLIAPGGGGGGVGVATAGTSRSGGGGGGPGATASAIFPARTLSSTIYMILPRGGIGGSSASNATATTVALVTANPSSIATVPSNQYLLATFGAIGLTAGGGGAAGTVSSVANCQLAGRALSLNFNAGAAAGGAAGNPGVAVTLQGLCTGGGGGGSVATATPSNGGSVTTANAVNMFHSNNASQILAQGGQTSGSLDGVFGHSTILDSIPYQAGQTGWYSVGGGGGASSDAGTGGRGGDGGIGSGGGGGGGGVTGQGGRGGDGGPSFCLIEWW